MQSSRKLFPKKNIIVGYPTESFYALGVPANNAAAIRQLFKLKKREAGKPIALIAADLSQVKKFFYLSPEELQFATQHWPGALTIVLRPKKSICSSALLGLTTPTPLLTRRRGQARIGVRVPSHKQARSLAVKAGAPLTATSANISGQPPTKSVRKLKQDFPDILIVSGKCGRSTKPSTIVEVVNKKIIIHRQGAVHV